VKLFSNYSNLRDHDTSTSQTDRRTERQLAVAIYVSPRGNEINWMLVAAKHTSFTPLYFNRNDNNAEEVQVKVQCVSPHSLTISARTQRRLNNEW